MKFSRDESILTMEVRAYRSPRDFKKGRDTVLDDNLPNLKAALELAESVVVKGEYPITAVALLGEVKPVHVFGLENC